MDMLFFLLLFPAVIGLLLLLIRGDKARGLMVVISAAVMIIVSVAIVIENYGSGTIYIDIEGGQIGTAMLIIEAALAAGLFCLGIKYKKYLASVLAVIQAVLIIWFELGTGHDIHAVNNLYIDGLSMIMILIVGVIGSLITIYSLGYMKDFHEHHSGQKDRRPWFFFLMFIFLSAMFGIVTSNNLIWMLFFWEVTTVCSFLLIGYTRTEEARNNSFRALIMNLVGGIAFTTAIIIVGTDHGTVELDQMIALGISGTDLALPVALLVMAGIIKAAQMPFQSWLLGAMAAPTPTSALLHSSTMVKAGVFLVIKLSPLLGTNGPGYLAMMIGGATFILASMMAVSQSNAKRVLAYSTIANLGLIIACAGVGTYAAVWAAIMLLIFHAVTKSLLFLSVGTAEHNIGSRDIEDMDGLFNRMPVLATFMIIGIVGMFLAPFGMLISKWAAMIEFVDSGNLALIVCICFGSAVTAFYWVKWLGKMVAIVAGEENIEQKVHRTEWTVLGSLAALVVTVCLFFPLISSDAIIPILNNMFATGTLDMTTGNLYLMTAMLALVLILPLFLLKGTKRRIVPLYMCGVNTGDDRSFISMKNDAVDVSLRNWYLEDWFGERKLTNPSVMLTTSIILIVFAYIGLVAGGVL
jgi:NADH:ubiquinone oxidoreductase subunit 5 (chain L)/Multisubunit Na+/H+ antiporter, MnhA subunit